ncbi:unnamed protein product [Polarella glacialis]|uniref:Uncharacterized protein n=1 Tax=Polarella glacialis TaxID=89957 RepID=A0A813GIP2_POLGL|nr:unnamed protein product [Polarella glacialis]CAE8740543.1 unnamed protein product [Polarella glacialis]
MEAVRRQASPPLDQPRVAERGPQSCFKTENMRADMVRRPTVGFSRPSNLPLGLKPPDKAVVGSGRQPLFSLESFREEFLQVCDGCDDAQVVIDPEMVFTSPQLYLSVLLPLVVKISLSAAIKLRQGCPSRRPSKSHPLISPVRAKGRRIWWQKLADPQEEEVNEDGSQEDCMVWLVFPLQAGPIHLSMATVA